MKAASEGLGQEVVSWKKVAQRVSTAAESLGQGNAAFYHGLCAF